MTTQVLIVEADAALAEVMLELLGRERCRVTAVNDLGQAVACLHRDSVDLVILDADTVPWPDAGGTLTTLAPGFRRELPPPSLVVVSVRVPPRAGGGRRATPFEEAAKDPGVTWLRKPFRNEEFLSVVRACRGGTAGNWHGPP